jgi:ABC-type uncharacterized transport system involved in gliding motility auxiliary subunit
MLASDSRLKYLALPVLAISTLLLLWVSSKVFNGAGLDLTEHRIHSLSAGTEKIIAGINKPIYLNLYYSDKASAEMPQFRVYAQRVQSLLKQIEAASNGKIKLQIIDPVAFSVAEDEAAASGLQAVPVGSSGSNFYFGLVGKRTNDKDGEKTVLMPFIDPSKEAFLEYDLAKLIATLNVDKPPVLAILSSLLTGPSINAATGQPSLGWVVDRKLSERYEMRRLQPNPSSIGDDVDVLMLVHPRNLPEPSLFAIDQFVLRGGHLLVFVDPNAESDNGSGPSGEGLESVSASDLKPLFQSWGLEYNAEKVVLDSQYAMQVGNANQVPQYHLEVLGLTQTQLNQKDVVSADLEKLNVSSAGSLGVTEKSSLKLDVLVQSSNAAMLADAQTVRLAESSPESLRKTFKATGESYILAARFSGILKSAFVAKSAPKQLMSSKKPAQIVVVADTDILTDRLWVQEQDFLGAPVYNDIANNGDFIMNIVDHLMSDENLISLRTRAVSARPFDRVEKIQRSAQLRYRDKQLALQSELDELNKNLEKLQGEQGFANNPNFNKSQQQAVQAIQKKKALIRTQLRDVQHQLNNEIEELVGEVKFFNIVLVPGLVALLAFLYGWRRSYKRRSFLPH